MKREIAGLRTLITGASSGIGRHLAVELARQGSDLVLFARRRSELEILASEIAALGRRAVVVAGDVTLPADRQATLDAAIRELGGLDVLVNNAGISAHSLFVQGSAERLLQIMTVNFLAAAELTRQAIPLLGSGRQPLVVNVGSILGQRGVPFNADYCASKFALHGWTESLRVELAPANIDVLLVAPGTTDTDFVSHLIDRQVEIPWGGRRGAKPSRVARAIVSAMRKGRRQITPSFSGWAFIRLARWSPRLVDWILKRYL